ncbi:hypothetical protein B0H10DRAFT_1787829 [Mycena sp. CBHHK59/15]|nr:hypothetical protein B0H10DRAFT_1787829 [Mycena sp. CBHHK59/15]
MSVRPFSPSESFAFPSPPREHRVSDWGVMPIPGIVKTLVPDVPTPTTYTENPFADAFSSEADAAPLRASAEFDSVETVWRPFEHTLADEISVSAGDQVHVLGIYDDGWAMIERVGMGKGKAKAVDGQPSAGLIPIDCMRMAGQPVSSFLASKRVSSVNATGYTAMAV